MKQKLLIISFILIYNQSFSQVSVVGKVVDGNKNVIPAATVSTSGRSNEQGVTTDLAGKFELVLSAPGSYSLEVRSVGFDVYNQSYEFSEHKVYDLGTIVLTEFVQQLQTVEVIGRLQRDYN